MSKRLSNKKIIAVLPAYNAAKTLEGTEFLVNSAWTLSSNNNDAKLHLPCINPSAEIKGILDNLNVSYIIDNGDYKDPIKLKNDGMKEFASDVEYTCVITKPKH